MPLPFVLLNLESIEIKLLEHKEKEKIFLEKIKNIFNNF